MALPETKQPVAAVNHRSASRLFLRRRLGYRWSAFFATVRFSCLRQTSATIPAPFNGGTLRSLSFTGPHNTLLAIEDLKPNLQTLS
ncbi:hypothetical protein CUMW_103560 [Citrus unshiu]|nr:hypothetical protein CUMW_103560 [Citrus unshiu]